MAQPIALQRWRPLARLGHRSQRYIQRYTNPPEAVAAGYVEGCESIPQYDRRHSSAPGAVRPVPPPYLCRDLPS